MTYEEKKQSVYELLTTIPKGKVVTYGQVSNALGLKSPRMVGRILHQNSEPKKYPCHRVVFADGSLAKAYAFGGEGVQRDILREEGVEFNGQKVNLTVSQYEFGKIKKLDYSSDPLN